MNTDLIRKASVQELCAHRARAIELYKITLDRLAEARDAHGKATNGNLHSAPSLGGMRDRYRPVSLEDITRDLDRSIWAHLIKMTQLGAMFDAKAKQQFEEGLKSDQVPPATEANITATLFTLLGNADKIFKRGLVEAFRRTFSSAHRSNDGFKIGERAILDYCIGEWGVNHYKADWLRDLERVVHVLDGKPQPEYPGGLIGAINAAMREGKSETETAYFRAKWFKNQNLHLYFLRQDLREAANRILAEHYGAAVPAGHEARNAGAHA